MGFKVCHVNLCELMCNSSETDTFLERVVVCLNFRANTQAGSLMYDSTENELLGNMPTKKEKGEQPSS